jgi:hypothetical protein
MRRAFLFISLVAIATIAIAATASARTETRFSVVASKGHGHQVGSHSFLQHGRLSQPGDRDDVVGRYQAKFTQRSNHKLRLRAVASFPGQGSLKAKGFLSGRNSRVPIIGGTGAFNGAAGKLKIHNLRHGRALLTFIFVQ